MRFQINFRSPKPVYLQLVDQVKAAVASGALRDGEPLPSIRSAAEDLRVNRNTVARAYAELDRQGAIETRLGRGCVIRATASPYTKDARLRLLTREIDDAVVQAHHLRVGKPDLLRLVGERCDLFERQRARAAAGAAS